jgi:hypothetical protein
MGCSRICGIDSAPSRQYLIEQLGGISPGFFSPIIPETHVLGTLNQILNDPFPERIDKQAFSE